MQFVRLKLIVQREDLIELNTFYIGIDKRYTTAIACTYQKHFALFNMKKENVGASKYWL